MAEPPVAAVDDDGDGVPTALIILGAVLLLLLLLLFAWWRSSVGSGTAEHSAWRDRAFAVYASGAAVHDALAVQTTGSSQTASTQQDLERRVSELAVDLHALEIDPPNATTAAALQDVIGTLTTLRSAVQGDLSLSGTDQPADREATSASLVRRRLAEFDGSLRAFKAAI